MKKIKILLPVLSLLLLTSCGAEITREEALTLLDNSVNEVSNGALDNINKMTVTSKGKNNGEKFEQSVTVSLNDNYIYSYDKDGDNYEKTWRYIDGQYFYKIVESSKDGVTKKQYAAYTDSITRNIYLNTVTATLSGYLNSASSLKTIVSLYQSSETKLEKYNSTGEGNLTVTFSTISDGDVTSKEIYRLNNNMVYEYSCNDKEDDTDYKTLYVSNYAFISKPNLKNFTKVDIL